MWAVGMILTFLGTKGGTGTTTMAVNCAADIRRISTRPTLIADVKQAGDVGVFLGLRPRYALGDLLDQVGWTDRELMTRFITEHDCGLHVLPASEGFARPNARDAEGVEETLRCLSEMYDYLVIDAGSTLTESTVAALALSAGCSRQPETLTPEAARAKGDELLRQMSRTLAAAQAFSYRADQSIERVRVNRARDLRFGEAAHPDDDPVELLELVVIGLHDVDATHVRPPNDDGTSEGGHDRREACVRSVTDP